MKKKKKFNIKNIYYIVLIFFSFFWITGLILSIHDYPSYKNYKIAVSYYNLLKPSISLNEQIKELNSYFNNLSKEEKQSFSNESKKFLTTYPTFNDYKNNLNNPTNNQLTLYKFNELNVYYQIEETGFIIGVSLLSIGLTFSIPITSVILFNFLKNKKVDINKKTKNNKNNKTKEKQLKNKSAAASKSKTNNNSNRKQINKTSNKKVLNKSNKKSDKKK